jgi:hypothetical protein
MSSLPLSAPGAFPWERRTELGIVSAYVQSVKLLLTNPDDAWSRARENGGYEDPLLFAIASAVVGSIFSALYRWVFPSPWVRFLPYAIRHRWMAPGMHRGMGGCGLVLWPVAMAIGVTVGLFVASAVFHACLMMVGGLSNSTSRFEGTFRTVSYSSVSMLAHVVPFAGGLISFVWGFFLNVKGAVRMHRTTPGKAAAALLIPLALLIVLLIGILAVVVGLLMATRSSANP